LTDKIQLSFTPIFLEIIVLLDKINHRLTLM